MGWEQLNNPSKMSGSETLNDCVKCHLTFITFRCTVACEVTVTKPMLKLYL